VAQLHLVRESWDVPPAKLPARIRRVIEVVREAEQDGGHRDVVFILRFVSTPVEMAAVSRMPYKEAKRWFRDVQEPRHAELVAMLRRLLAWRQLDRQEGRKQQ
jgi:hypothetical protein